MAGILQKILRKHSSFRTITTFNNPQLPKTPPKSPLPPFFNHLHLTEPKLQNPNTQNPFLGSLNTDQINSSQQFYSSFSIGLFLNPISPFAVVQSEEVKEVVDAGDKMWADSVKKKRKKKMNKHKYKKLRKRLRRKTKT